MITTSDQAPSSHATGRRLNPSIAAVVVTHNRLELLKECLAALLAQTHKLDRIFVVDNASTDATGQYLAELVQTSVAVEVITQGNLGSSGGQFTGIKAAVTSGHGWVWCMDDDTIPRPDALERMVAAPAFTDPSTGFLSSMVLWTDGSPHQMNVPAVSDAGAWLPTVLQEKAVRVRTSSFVALLLSRAAVESVGLPIKQMFIWYDDVEYTARITRKLNGYCVLDSIVTHKTPYNTSTVLGRIAKKDYFKACYGARNWVICLRTSGRSFPRRAMKVLEVFLGHLGNVFRGIYPVRILGWVIKGMFFRIRVEKV